MRKLLLVLLSLISVICMAFSFGGCSEEQQKEVVDGEMGKFYSLQEAYDNSWISKKNLKAIAKYHNKSKTYPVALTDEEETAIKEAAAREVSSDARNRPDAKAEDFVILKYYGNYNGYYAIIIQDTTTLAPAVMIDDWISIGDVKIHYITIDKIIIWRSYN